MNRYNLIVISIATMILINCLYFILYVQNFWKSWLISPYGRKKMLWDCLQVAAILFTICEAPFTLGFLGNLEDTFSEITIDNILVIIFGIDILVSFNCSFVDVRTNSLSISRKDISLRYLQSWFLVDLVSSIPLKQIAKAILNYQPNEYFSILRAIRILRLSRLALVCKLFDTERLSNRDHESKAINISPQIRNIFTLFLQVSLSGHIACCFWFFITTDIVTDKSNQVNSNSNSVGSILDPNWATEFGYHKLAVFDQYIASLYWTFETLFTIGYGDIHATNTSENIFSIIVMLAGSILFGAIIAKIKDLLDSRNIQKNEINAKIDEFKEFVEEKKYPNNLKIQAKVRYIFECILYNDSDIVFKGL